MVVVCVVWDWVVVVEWDVDAGKGQQKAQAKPTENKQQKALVA